MNGRYEKTVWIQVTIHGNLWTTIFSNKSKISQLCLSRFGYLKIQRMLIDQLTNRKNSWCGQIFFKNLPRLFGHFITLHVTKLELYTASFVKSYKIPTLGVKNKDYFSRQNEDYSQYWTVFSNALGYFFETGKIESVSQAII
jgi:hypothetical protein